MNQVCGARKEEGSRETSIQLFSNWVNGNAIHWESSYRGKPQVKEKFVNSVSHILSLKSFYPREDVS